MRVMIHNFSKNLLNKFREKFKRVDFEYENDPFPPPYLKHNENFYLKSKTVTLHHFLVPVVSKNFRKI